MEPFEDAAAAAGVVEANRTEPTRHRAAADNAADTQEEDTEEEESDARVTPTLLKLRAK